MRAAPQGFTLLELLLSLSVVAVLAVIAIPVSLSFQRQNDFRIAVETTVQSLRRAQALAQAVDGDTPWGVHLEPGSITLFAGADYSSRTVGLDEAAALPASIIPSGLTDVVFAKLSGFPQTTGTITLASGAHDTASVAVNAKGMIDY